MVSASLAEHMLRWEGGSMAAYSTLELVTLCMAFHLLGHS